MLCKRKYRILLGDSLVDFDCRSLRKHYARISSDKMANPEHIKQVRETLMKCPECNQSRVDMLKNLDSENSKKILKEYETVEKDLVSQK